MYEVWQVTQKCLVTLCCLRRTGHQGLFDHLYRETPETNRNDCTSVSAVP